MDEVDLVAGDWRTVHVYDTGPCGGPAAFWQHLTPNVGTSPEPLFELSRSLGLRWVSHYRPGYRGSTPRPGRTVGSVAADVAAV